MNRRQSEYRQREVWQLKSQQASDISQFAMRCAVPYSFNHNSTHRSSKVCSVGASIPRVPHTTCVVALSCAVTFPNNHLARFRYLIERKLCQAFQLTIHSLQCSVISTDWETRFQACSTPICSLLCSTFPCSNNH